MSEELRNLEQVIEQLTLEERTVLSDQFAKWYNLVIRLYKKDFGIDDDNSIRSFKGEEQVITFFREALLWWYRRKPKIEEILNPLDALKTRTCLGQIHSLKKRLEDTGVSLGKLKLNDHLEVPKISNKERAMVPALADTA